MKKVLIIVLIAVVAGSSIFAMDLSLGVMQNFVDTSIIADMEFDHFGVEGSLGFPLLWGIPGVINGISEGEDIDFGEGVALVLLPGFMTNGYWKAIDGKHFGLRLGLQIDGRAFIDEDTVQFIALPGISLGLNYKFNEKFSMNLTAGCPFALILAMAGSDLGEYAFFYTAKGNTDNGWELLGGAVLGTLGDVVNQFGRLSFKWKI